VWLRALAAATLVELIETDLTLRIHVMRHGGGCSVSQRERWLLGLAAPEPRHNMDEGEVIEGLV
jgi:hypothetical protein